jgi:hypothetical protein
LGENSALGDGPKGQAPQRGGSGHGRHAPILALIAFTVFFSFAYAGPWVYDQLIDAVVPLYGDAGCPDGGFHLVQPTPGNPLPPANGADRDLNKDGWYCIKTEANTGTDLPGNGNSNKNSDIKDNSRPSP